MGEFDNIPTKVAKSYSNKELAEWLTKIDAKPGSIFWPEKEAMAKEFKRREKLQAKRK